MAEFRRLALCSILCGAIAGLVWFAAQYSLVVPLIQRAELYELAAQHDASDPPHEHSGGEWRPSEGFERNSLTLAATVLAGIGLAAMLFGTIVVLGQTIDVRQGIL